MWVIRLQRLPPVNDHLKFPTHCTRRREDHLITGRQRTAAHRGGGQASAIHPDAPSPMTAIPWPAPKAPINPLSVAKPPGTPPVFPSRERQAGASVMLTKISSPHATTALATPCDEMGMVRIKPPLECG